MQADITTREAESFLLACLADLSTVRVFADWLGDRSDPREHDLRRYYRSWERGCREAQTEWEAAVFNERAGWERLAEAARLVGANCDVTYEVFGSADIEPLNNRFRRYLKRKFREWCTWKVLEFQP